MGIGCSLARIANYTFADDADATSDPSSAKPMRHAPPASMPSSSTTLRCRSRHSERSRLRDQIQFDPVAYLEGLADALDAGGEPVIFEGSRVESVNTTSVVTAAGSVKAERVILATHLDARPRRPLCARRAESLVCRGCAHPRRHYRPGCLWTAARSTRSAAFRTTAGGLLLVGGQSHRIGQGDPGQSIAALEKYARERFAASDFEYRWDAHDFVSEDRLPFVGSVTPRGDRVLTVTGLSKWGLALGAACAEISRLPRPAAGRSGRPSSTPSGHRARADGPRSPSMAPRPRLHITGDRLKRADEEELAPGDGAVVGDGLGQQAVFRDDDGTLHRLSARCTHLGCIVAFNKPARNMGLPVSRLALRRRRRGPGGPRRRTA